MKLKNYELIINRNSQNLYGSETKVQCRPLHVDVSRWKRKQNRYRLQISVFWPLRIPTPITQQNTEYKLNKNGSKTMVFFHHVLLFDILSQCQNNELLLIWSIWDWFVVYHILLQTEVLFRTPAKTSTRCLSMCPEYKSMAKCFIATFLLFSVNSQLLHDSAFCHA